MLEGLHSGLRDGRSCVLGAGGGELTLGQVHDSHTDARDDITQAILADLVAGQPGENREPGEKESLQSRQRTPEGRQQREEVSREDGWMGKKRTNKSEEDKEESKKERKVLK